MIVRLVNNSFQVRPSEFLSELPRKIKRRDVAQLKVQSTLLMLRLVVGKGKRRTIMEKHLCFECF